MSPTLGNLKRKEEKMTLTEHQKIWAGKCPMCSSDIYWDEDQERNVFTCDCMNDLEDDEDQGDG